MFYTRLSVLPSVHPIHYIFPQYLHYLLMDFHQTFVIGTPWDKDELIRFWGQTSRSNFCGGGKAYSTRPSFRVKLSMIWYDTSSNY